jgi:hypothetical protein
MRVRGALPVAVIALAFSLLFLPARASGVTTYAHGMLGVYGTLYTPGTGARTFNEVWHQDGTQWGTRYCWDTPVPGGCVIWKYSTINPWYDGRSCSGACQAEAYNTNDGTSTLWTLQTG